MSIFDNNTGWLVQRRKGSVNDPFIDVEETITVAGGKAILKEIPDEFNSITISDGSNDFYVKKDGNPDTDTIVVDFNIGYVYFDSSYEGDQFTAYYKGTGQWFLNSARVFSKLDSNKDVAETMKELVDATEQAKDDANNQANFAQNQGDYAKTQGDRVESAVDTTKMNYLEPVETYDDISTTYTSPSLGDTCVALDTKIRYRYNGTSWVQIDQVDTANSYVVGNFLLESNSEDNTLDFKFIGSS